MSHYGHLEPFIALAGGGKFYPFGPRAEDITIDDIAHSLANLCRYNGHTSEFWSVAAHCIEVSRRVEKNTPNQPTLWLTALLHDAAEAALGDITAPIKPVFINYKQWEANIEVVLANKFGLIYPWPGVVEWHDKAIVRDEVANFFPEGSEAWRRYDIHNRGNHPKLVSLLPDWGKTVFLDRYYYLTNRIAGGENRGEN